MTMKCEKHKKLFIKLKQNQEANDRLIMLQLFLKNDHLFISFTLYCLYSPLYKKTNPCCPGLHEDHVKEKSWGSLGWQLSDISSLQYLTVTIIVRGFNNCFVDCIIPFLDKLWFIQQISIISLVDSPICHVVACYPEPI